MRRVGTTIMVSVLLAAAMWAVPAVASSDVVQRVAGGDRVATAVAAAGHGWSSADTVVVARSDDPADALAGSALAGAHDAPLLITPSSQMPAQVLGEVERLGAKRAFVLGGVNAVSESVLGQLRAAGVAEVVRVSGATRYATAVAIADQLQVPAGGQVLLVGNWPDALGVASVAAERARQGRPSPVLITAADRLPDETARALEGLAPSRVVIVGGTSVVSESVEGELQRRGFEVERRAGGDRYATSRGVAALSTGEGPLVVATGAAFPDGLSAGPLAARIGGTLVLVPRSARAADVAFIDGMAGVRELVIVGGPAAIDNDAEKALRAAISGRPAGENDTRPPTSAQTPSADVVVFVDGSDPGASDGNSGSVSAPFKSVGAGVGRADAANRDGKSAHVVVAAGTYRESVRLGQHGATSAAVTIEGRGDVVVSGSQPYTDWSSVGGGVFRHGWSHNWGLSPVPDAWLNGYGGEQLKANPVIRRREMVFVDGRLMKPFTDRAAMEATPGSFFVDEANDQLLVRAPAGVDLRSAKVEVAERDTLLQIGNRSNVTVRNVRLQHAASPAQGKALVVSNSLNVVIDGVDLVWNSWVGMAVARSSNVTVRNSRADHNGVGGMTGFEGDDLLVVDSSTSYNNWRGIRGAEGVEQGRSSVDMNFVDYAAGQKFLYMRRTTFRRHQAVGNLASGLWFDFDNRDIRIEDSVLNDNLTWGVFFEANSGPFTMTGSTAAGNEIGVHVANSENGTVVGNTLGSNLLAEIFVGGRYQRYVSFRDGGGANLTSHDWTIRDNRIGTIGTNARAFGTKLRTDGGWQAFVADLDADHNTYSYQDRADAWVFPSNDRTDLSGWRSRFGADRNSTITKAPPPA